MTVEEQIQNIADNAGRGKPSAGRYTAEAIRKVVVQTIREDRERVAWWLENRADMYAKDGLPGMLGYNCPGWRDIAATLREEALLVRKLEEKP